ncbi:MAG: hypothetical protein R2827_03755 [Bdellovibrionales bacterium]
MGDANNLGNKTSNSAYRKLQRQILEKAIQALDDVPLRGSYSDFNDLAGFKSRLKGGEMKVLKFIEELDAYLKSGRTREEIYNMSFSLLPHIRFASKI